MRGQQEEKVDSEKDLKPLDYYQKHHAAYLSQLGSVFGFDDDELNRINELEKQAQSTDESDDDVDVFNLSDISEYDSDFVEEFNF